MPVIVVDISQLSVILSITLLHALSPGALIPLACEIVATIPPAIAVWLAIVEFTLVHRVVSIVHGASTLRHIAQSAHLTLIKEITGPVQILIFQIIVLDHLLWVLNGTKLVHELDNVGVNLWFRLFNSH